ncbi:arabinogalactan O-methyltransferase 1-like [Aristolochia californica]|uniref:arabinogalactan O-methyltransferase 1-like n=1 Tax=Aristolochia californica TaxID=171875 RepID=UPI0035E3298F
MKKEKAMGNRLWAERPLFIALAIAAFMAGALLLSNFHGRSADRSFLCGLDVGILQETDTTAAPIQLQAILHYATSKVVPQQSLAEIRVSFNVLQRVAPCNFLVFGLGHDSLMWTSFNPGGTTLFLEEDPKWVQSVLKTAPMLNARTVPYRTQLSEADELLKSYKQEAACLPPRIRLQGNDACRLALSNLPEQVYEREWDLIMIDAPRGYFNEAPGRMGAIFSAAVMARNRQKEGVTHVFLHDVDRKVERVFAEEFLCAKYRVKATGRLWHFEIPPVTNWKEGDGFC